MTEAARTYQREYKRRWRELPDNLRKSQEANARYRVAHPDRIKRIQRASDQKRKRHPNRVASQAKYRRNNPAVTAAGWERWRERHLERFIHFMRLHALRRHARKLAAPGSHTLEQWLQRVVLYGWRCAYCRKELNVDTLRKDHVKPLVAGGADWPANLVPSCVSCNSRKHKKRWIPRLR